MTRLLIVEDEPELLRILRQLFEAEGYTVLAAADGIEALNLLAASSDALDGTSPAEAAGADCALLDVMLPGLDGFALCRLIRAESDMPIIIATALGAEHDQLKAFGLLADDYVTKPYSLAVVRERVKAVLRRSGGAGCRDGAASAGSAIDAAGAPPDGGPGTGGPRTPQRTARHGGQTRRAEPAARPARLAHGGIVMDLDAREVSHDGRPITLTRSEFDLLAVLFEQPHRVLTRAQLIERVWGADHEGAARSVNLHIMNLRRKLGIDCIDTVRGVGYRAGRR